MEVSLLILFCRFHFVYQFSFRFTASNSSKIIIIFFAMFYVTPVCMYVCKTLFTDASLVNKIVGFHKGRQTIKKRIKEDIYKRTEKERKKKK